MDAQLCSRGQRDAQRCSKAAQKCSRGQGDAQHCSKGTGRFSALQPGEGEMLSTAGRGRETLSTAVEAGRRSALQLGGREMLSAAGRSRQLLCTASGSPLGFGAP